MLSKIDMSPPLYAAVEAGGTKVVCAVAYEPAQPLALEKIPTTTPKETIARVLSWFQKMQEELGQISALAIGSFGPIDIHPQSDNFGKILNTPKPNWAGADLLGEITKGLGASIRYAIDTDVNVAALGEFSFGAGRGYENVAYVTVGTGIGASYLVNGTPLNGRMHPEVGHMFIPNLEGASSHSKGVCPFHDSCLEGWASGPAIEQRWGASAHDLPVDHPAWDLQAQYLAHLVVNLTAMWSPDTVIFGGGVSQQEHLLPAVRQHFSKLANRYWELPSIENYIQQAALGQNAGIVGALQLANRSLSQK